MQREMPCALTTKTERTLSRRRHNPAPRQPLGQTVMAIHRQGHRPRRAAAMRHQGHRQTAAAMRRLVHRPAAVHRRRQGTLSLPLRAMAIVRPKSSSGKNRIKGPLRRI